MVEAETELVNIKKELPAEFEETVNDIIRILAFKKTFGIYEKEDIAQEIWLLCWQAMDGYTPGRNLYNFLLTCTKNGLQNLKRNKYFRYSCPCKKCSFKHNGETDHTDKLYCKKYLKWRETNNRKKNLAAPILSDFKNSEKLFDRHENHEDVIDNADFLEMIDRKLPTHLRSSYLKMKSGVFAPAKDKEEIMAFIKQFTDLLND